MIHVVTTPPAIEPVSLSEMRAHLGIGQSQDTNRDPIIAGRIATARNMVEKYTGTAIMSQTLTGYSNVFDAVIPLCCPAQSITSIVYIDSDGTEQTLATDQYEIDTVTSVVVPAYGVSWPSARLKTNSVRVQYVAGYGDTAEDVPPPLLDAIKFMVGQWEVFQNTIEGGVRPLTIPNAAKELINPYIDWRGVMKRA